MRHALALRSQLLEVQQPEGDFDFQGFQIFTSVPSGRDFGIVSLLGMVVVYDEAPLHREGILAGSFYVRESQHPRSGMDWSRWLSAEWEDRSRRAGPGSRLETRREVVQAIRWPYENDWSVRLSSGFVDGPYYDWAFGLDFVGKVVGIYRPQQS